MQKSNSIEPIKLYHFRKIRYYDCSISCTSDSFSILSSSCTLTSNETCTANGCVETCGYQGGSCCPGNTCDSGLTCCSDNTCQYECGTCSKDADCSSGEICYCGICSSSWINGKCTSDECCNRGYGGVGIGSCVSTGTIYGNYLCGG